MALKNSFKAKPLSDVRKDIPVDIVQSKGKARVNFDLEADERMRWHVYALAHQKTLKTVIIEAMHEYMSKNP